MNLPVTDIVPRDTQQSAIYKTMQLKLNFASQTRGCLFSGARHKIMQRNISTLKQHAEVAQYCIVRCSNSTAKKEEGKNKK